MAERFCSRPPAAVGPEKSLPLISNRRKGQGFRLRSHSRRKRSAVKHGTYRALTLNLTVHLQLDTSAFLLNILSGSFPRALVVNPSLLGSSEATLL